MAVLELFAEQPVDERRHVDPEVRAGGGDVAVDAGLDLAVEEALVGPGRVPPGAITPGHVVADATHGLLRLLARRIQPEPAQELQGVEGVGVVLGERVAGPEPVRRLERQELRTPALGRDACPFGRHLVGGGVKEVAHHLPADGGVAVQQPVDGVHGNYLAGAGESGGRPQSRGRR
jgi:hypothetical protein